MPLPDPVIDAPEIRVLVSLSRTYTVIEPTGVNLIVTVVLCADKLIVALALLDRYPDLDALYEYEPNGTLLKVTEPSDPVVPEPPPEMLAPLIAAPVFASTTLTVMVPVVGMGSR